MYGDKPYDKNITPVENLFVTIAAMGELKKLENKNSQESLGTFFVIFHGF
jgi:hypothetical protein